MCGRFLQAIGVEPDERGLLNVDDSYETAQAGVYACGDVIGYPALASISMEQGTRAAHHMWSSGPEVRFAGMFSVQKRVQKYIFLAFADSFWFHCSAKHLSCKEISQSRMQVGESKFWLPDRSDTVNIIGYRFCKYGTGETRSKDLPSSAGWHGT